jgi:hypothetical protein
MNYRCLMEFIVSPDELERLLSEYHRDRRPHVNLARRIQKLLKLE